MQVMADAAERLSEESSQVASRGGDLLRKGRQWWLWFLPLWMITLAWSFATPLLASPDESSHLARIAAIGRGQLTGPDRLSGFGFTTEVRVPGTYNNLLEASLCFLGRPDVTPACKPKLRLDPAERATATFGRYPPLYYFLMAVPTRMVSPPGVAYLIRIMTGLLSAAFLASAFLAAQSLGRWALLGVAGATTPMVLYLGSVVNPSGLELACAVALWTSVVALSRGPRIDTRSLVISGVSFVFLANLRGISLPMAVIALALPLALASRTRLSEVMHRFRAWWWSAPVMLGGATAIAWGELRGPGPVSPFSRPPFTRTHLSIADGLVRSRRLFEESIAWFGQRTQNGGGGFEVRVVVAIVIWFFLWAIILLVGLRRGATRDRLVLGTAALVALVFPIYVSIVLHPPPIYRDWQGRHGLPLWVGVPILGGAVAATAGRQVGRRLWPIQVALPTAFAFGQTFAFAAAAHRYAVGSQGRVLYFVDPLWGETHKHLLLLGLAVVGSATLAWRVGFSPIEDHRAVEVQRVTSDDERSVSST
jgi:hypothetical protein